MSILERPSNGANGPTRARASQVPTPPPAYRPAEDAPAPAFLDDWTESNARVTKARPPVYEIVITPGRLFFANGVTREEVDDAIDHDSKTYTQAGRLNRLAAVRAAFSAGYRAAVVVRRLKGKNR